MAGTVSLPLNAVGKTILMIEDQEDMAGAEVRLYGKERPELTAGQWVTVRGKVKRDGDDWRINVSKGGLAVSESQTPPVPTPTEPGRSDRNTAA